MSLSNHARRQLQLLFTRTAQAYSRQGMQFKPHEQFSASPTTEQTLVRKLVEDGNWFMPYVNTMLVRDKTGQKVLMSASGRSASRTDTSTAPTARRTPRNLLATDGKTYTCTKTDHDFRLNYTDIDAWSKFPNFAAMYNAICRQEMANSMLRVGWYGETAETETDLNTNPNLEDVNIGWLQIMRSYNTGSNYVLGSGGSPVALGSADYPTLDSLVVEFKNSIPKYLRNDLVVYVSDDLVGAAEGTYYAANEDKGAEKLLIAQQKRVILETYGGLPAVVPPFFPDGTVLIAPMNALQLYIQGGSIRRTQKDEPEYDWVAEYNSANEGYAIEREDACFLVEGITIE